MVKNAEPSGSVAALPEVMSGAVQNPRTADMGNIAVVFCNGSTSSLPGSNLKAGIITVLGWLLAWRPTLAMLLGRLVLRVWPGFRRA